MVTIGEGWRHGVDGRAQFRGAEQSARNEIRRPRFSFITAARKSRSSASRKS